MRSITIMLRFFIMSLISVIYSASAIGEETNKLSSFLRDCDKGNLKQILIVPSINKFKEEKVLRASGIAILTDREIKTFLEQLNENVMPRAAMRQPEWYTIYLLFKDKGFDDSHVFTCQLENNSVNIVLKINGEEVYLGMPDKISKIITECIVRKVLIPPSVP